MNGFSSGLGAYRRRRVEHDRDELGPQRAFTQKSMDMAALLGMFNCFQGESFPSAECVLVCIGESIRDLR